MFCLKYSNSYKYFPLDSELITVGLHPENDIVLSEPGIQDFHAEFFKKGQQYFLRSITLPERTRLNGKPVENAICIEEDDDISFADVNFYIGVNTKIKEIDDKGIAPQESQNNIPEDVTVIQQINPNTQNVSASDWILKSKDPRIDDIRIPINTDFVIGKNPSCNYVILQGLLSRRHAQLHCSNNDVKIEDLGSVNGTFVNDVKIHSHLARHGDEIRFDVVKFILLNVNQAENDATRFTDPYALVEQKTQPSIDEESDKTVVKEFINNSVDLPQENSQNSSDNARHSRPIEPNLNSTEPDTVPSKEKLTSWKAAATTGDGTVVMAMLPQFPVLLGMTDEVANASIELNKSEITIGRNPASDIVLNDLSVSTNHAKLVKSDDIFSIVDFNSANGTYVNDNKVSQKELKHNDTIRFGRTGFQFQLPNEVNKSSVASQIANTRKKNWIPIGVVASVAILGLIIAGNFLLSKNDLPKTPNSVVTPLALNYMWHYSINNSDNLSSPQIDKLSDVNQGVIIGDDKGLLYAIDGNTGQSLFTQRLGDRFVRTFPVDFSSNGNQSIIAYTDDATIKAFSSVGSILWQNQLAEKSNQILNDPAFADLNQDQHKDIILPTNNGLVAINGKNGKILLRTTQHTKGKVITKPISADINSDGNLDLISLSHLGQLLAVTFVNNQVNVLWSINLPTIMMASPTLITQQSNRLIIVATHNQGIFAIDALDGKQKWHVKMSEQYFSSPVQVDINNDQKYEVVLLSLDGQIALLNSDTGIKIWQKQMSAGFQSSPVLHDVNGDRIKDIIVTDTEGSVHFINSLNGNIVLSSSVLNANRIVNTPAIGDLNKNGMLNIVFSSLNGSVTAYEVNRQL